MQIYLLPGIPFPISVQIQLFFIYKNRQMANKVLPPMQTCDTKHVGQSPPP